MTADGVSTRRAAVLTGLVRSTAIRHGKAAPALTPPVPLRPVLDPVNKLTVLERLRILEVLTSTRFVDMTPLQVYSWDITKLAGPVKGTYFDAYVMIDIYSRYIVGVHVHAHESGVLAKELMEQISSTHGVPQIVHTDRGTSMTSKTVAALLADLEVTRSHPRPRVPNDNPYSETLFKT